MVNAKPPQKKYFDVKVEAHVPALITYRILAESAEQALEISKTASPTGVRYQLAKKRDIKVMVYDAGSSILRFTKNLLRR